MIELVLAWGERISVASGIALVVIVVGGAMTIPFVAIDLDREQNAALRRWILRYRTAFVLLLLAFIASLPKVDDLWRIRVSLIKYHLASPDNVKAGVETIERIGKKLECRYLGCEEKSEAAK